MDDSFEDWDELKHFLSQRSISLPIAFHSQRDEFEDVDPAKTQRETIQNTLDNCLETIKGLIMQI